MRLQNQNQSNIVCKSQSVITVMLYRRKMPRVSYGLRQRMPWREQGLLSVTGKNNRFPCSRNQLNGQNSAHLSGKILIVPDKDADGLDAGVILYRSLRALGKSPSDIDVHLLPKGATIHDQVERESMLAKDPRSIIVIDQGSRPGPRIVDSPDVKSLVIDHHLSDEFPDDAVVRGAVSFSFPFFVFKY